MTKNDIKVDCRQCRHYYVTWDKRFPNGCRAMKFKGKVLPSITVLKNSGLPCMKYVKKEWKTKP